MMGAFAHVSSISTEKNRTTRMALLEFGYLLGLDLGVGLSKPLYDLGGYAAIYCLAIIVVSENDGGTLNLHLCPESIGGEGGGSPCFTPPEEVSKSACSLKSGLKMQ